MLAQFTGALLAAAPTLAAAGPAAASIPKETLLTLWPGGPKSDLAGMIKALGFNTVWTSDKPYDGYNLEDTTMYRHMNTPGVKYVIARIERSVWGWTHEQSLKHCDWLAKVSLTEKRIIGVYMNDFYGEVFRTNRIPLKQDPRDQGGRTREQWNEIIARIRAGNPALPIWLPCYPREELHMPFDYDFDGVIVNFYAQSLLQFAPEILSITQKKFKGKPMVAGIYLGTGFERRWLTEAEVKDSLGLFVQHINEGRMQGLRIFQAANLEARPEYLGWCQEALKALKR